MATHWARWGGGKREEETKHWGGPRAEDVLTDVVVIELLVAGTAEPVIVPDGTRLLIWI
jgi:hypothetical protein